MVNLTLIERNELLEQITEKQREFIEERLKIGQRTLFMRFMESEKVSVIKMTDDISLEEIEQQSQDWQIVDYFDYGLGNRAGKCACGRTLRFEFIVEHSLTKKRIHYGKDHLADFFNIDVADINLIINGLHEINYEADELLLKIQNSEYGHDVIDLLPTDATIPKEIQAHLDYGVPLLERQIKRLLKMVDVQVQIERERKIKEQSSLIEPNQPSMGGGVSVSKPSEKYGVKLEIIQEVNKHFEFMFLNGEVDIAEVAYQFVLKNIYSATTISFLIREYYNVSKELSRSITGRPRIYGDVLEGLHSYAKKGLIYHDKESSGIKDSYFFPKPLGTVNLI